jgi:hypothetical protein
VASTIPSLCGDSEEDGFESLVKGPEDGGMAENRRPLCLNKIGSKSDEGKGKRGARIALLYQLSVAILL